MYTPEKRSGKIYSNIFYKFLLRYLEYYIFIDICFIADTNVQLQN